VVALSFSSCTKGFDEFLEKPPGVDITEDTIFSTKDDIETFLFGTYMYGIHSYYAYNTTNSSINPNPTMCMTAAMCDEGQMAGTFYAGDRWNSATVLKSSIVSHEDSRFNLRWTALRRCNILLERLPEAAALTTTEREQYMGEVRFIRALNNFEMFKRYGGMPIVDKRLLATDNLNIPRSTVEEFVNFILTDCDAAATALTGVTYPANYRGRITKAAVLALKAKVLLYAASPLFNTDTPYISGTNNALVCYGNYSAQRWADAAAAAKAALDEAAAAGFRLLDNNKPETDYRDMWDTYDNVEIILAEKFTNTIGNWSHPWCTITPVGMGMSTWGGAGVCVPQNFIARYEKMDGTPQTWNAPGITGSDLMEKYAQLDPRFRQTIAYNGSAWNSQAPDLQLYVGGTVPSAADNVTGAFMHKLIPYRMTSTTNNSCVPNAMLFRVGELYLNYAEALNESLAGPSQAVYDAVNAIRDRAGMPNLPAGLSKEEMRERIKHERHIELAYEDHRFWDIRRWMDAEKEGVMQGTFYRMVIHKKEGTGLTQKADYTIQAFETRTFNRNMYMHPILEGEVNKGYLEQNPGW
jgi:hypothetical protein